MSRWRPDAGLVEALDDILQGVEGAREKIRAHLSRKCSTDDLVDWVRGWCSMGHGNVQRAKAALAAHRQQPEPERRCDTCEEDG